MIIGPIGSLEWMRSRPEWPVWREALHKNLRVWAERPSARAAPIHLEKASARIDEAEFWSRVLGKNVVAVYGGVPIIHVDDIEEVAMGVKELRAAFNEVSQPAATCMKALLEYERASDTEFQILYFSGNWADGSGFAIRSDRVRPNADVNLAARATAERLLQQKGTT